jgi:sugar lactone lactonase YvrE
MKLLRYILTAIIVFIFAIVSVPSVDASSATTYTITLNRKHDFVVTQDAYLPDQTILNLGLKSPQDLFVSKDDLIYIADTGNKRIVIYNPAIGQLVNEITYSEFVSPKGIFITDDNELYVADSAAEAVFRFKLDGTFIQKYEKPNAVSMESINFNPKKIAVDKQNNLYIIAEGVFDGIIQMSSSGEFLGYFATNNVVLTPTQQFQNLIFTDKQLEQLSNRNPVSFSNVYVDKNGIKYSTSIGEDISNLQKHNTNGSSSIDTNYGIDLSLVDVYTDQYGIIYTVSDSGMIDIFTSDGSFIFAFGANGEGKDISGLYSRLESIAVDSAGRIWTLDSDKAFIQSYVPTEYSQEIYKALTYYINGQYSDAVTSWEKVLKLNQLSVLAHNEIGRNLFSQGNYKESLQHFELSGNRYWYSMAYWEVRNVSIQKGLPYVLLFTLIFVVVYQIIKFTNRKYGYLKGLRKSIDKVKSIKIVDDILFAFAFFKHPLDSFYYLKKKQRGSYLGATVLFFLFFFVYLNYVLNKGFIFQFVEPEDMDLGAIVIGFFAIFALFILSNYLVTSINDGEGSIGEIYKGVMYTLMPLTIAYTAIWYLSYYVTFNEVILLQIIQWSGIGGTGLLLFLAVQELHNYTIRETIKSYLLTILFMLIMGILFAFIQIMGDQLLQFIIGLIKEVVRDVIG